MRFLLRRPFLQLMIATAVLATSLPAAAGANANGFWTTESPLPTARAVAATGSIGGLLYVAGGENSIISLATLEVYNPTTDTWTTKSPMPTAAYGAAGATINGRLYVAGGASLNSQCCPGPFNTLEVYDPGTDTWAARAPMPTPEVGAAAAVINGKLYVAGGVSQFVQNNPRNALLQIYDVRTNSWTAGASMPTARANAGAVAIKGKLYVVGGTTNNNGYTGVLEVYDPASNTWASKTPMPTPRQEFSAQVVRGRLYAIGGDPGNGSPQTGVNEVYNPTNDSWTTAAPMLTARYGMANGVIHGTTYLAGGATGFGWGVPQTVNEAFTP